MITAKKPSNVNIRELSVWLTSDYDYLAATHKVWGHSRHELLYQLDTPYFHFFIGSIFVIKGISPVSSQCLWCNLLFLFV